MQKDLTKVKIFQKVLGGLLCSETPCRPNVPFLLCKPRPCKANTMESQWMNISYS